MLKEFQISIHHSDVAPRGSVSPALSQVPGVRGGGRKLPPATANDVERLRPEAEGDPEAPAPAPSRLLPEPGNSC